MLEKREKTNFYIFIATGLSSIRYETASRNPFHHSTGPELAAVRLISGCKSLNPRLNRRAHWRAGRGGTVVPLSLTYRVNKRRTIAIIVRPVGRYVGTR